MPCERQVNELYHLFEEAYYNIIFKVHIQDFHSELKETVSISILKKGLFCEMQPPRLNGWICSVHLLIALTPPRAFVWLV